MLVGTEEGWFLVGFVLYGCSFWLLFKILGPLGFSLLLPKLALETPPSSGSGAPNPIAWLAYVWGRRVRVLLRGIYIICCICFRLQEGKSYSNSFLFFFLVWFWCQ